MYFKQKNPGKKRDGWRILISRTGPASCQIHYKDKLEPIILNPGVTKQSIDLRKHKS